MKKILLVYFIFSLHIPVLKSQPTFLKTFTKDSFEVAKSVVQTPDGGYAFLADIGLSTYTERWLVKTDASGDTMWTRSFPGGGCGFYLSLVQTPDSGFSLLVRQGDTTFLFHLSQNGDSLWAKPIGQESGYSLTPTSDNGYLAGSGILAGSAGMMTVSRLDQMGNIRWKKWFDLVSPGFASSPVVNSIKEVPGGGFIMAGGMYTPYFLYIPFLFRLSDNGDSLWYRTYGPYGDARFTSVDIIGDQGFYAGGEECAGSCNTLVMKLNPMGDTVWTRDQYLPGVQRINSLRTTAGGDVIVCGEYSGTSFSQDTMKLLVRRYDKNGNIVWDKRIGAYQAAVGMSLNFAADSGLIICGGMQTALEDLYHALLVRTDREGNVFGTGLAESPGLTVAVYPNPVSDFLTVHFPALFDGTVLQVFDITGRQVASEQRAFAGSTALIDVRSWPGGLYLLKVTYRNGPAEIRKVTIAR